MGSSGQEQLQQHPHHQATDKTFVHNDPSNVTQSPTHVARQNGPTRDWSAAYRELRWSLELHVYVSACLFSALAAICVGAAMKRRRSLTRDAPPQPHLFLGILAAARVAVLLIDPYGSRTLMPAVMLQVLWDLAHPCLVSAFSLAQLQTEDGWPRLLGESAASVVVTAHFCLVITSGVLGAVHRWLRVVWIVTQAVFIVWGAFLFLFTLVGCLRMLRKDAGVPLRCLQQVDPGCEVSTLVPLGMFTDENHRSLHAQHHPRIRITDVDDTTLSYAGDDVTAPPTTPLQRSRSLPLRCLVSADISPSRVKEESPADRAAASPLIVSSLQEIRHTKERVTLNAKEGHSERGPATIFGFETKPRSLSSIEARKPRRPSRGRLRHLVITSSLGVALCLQRTYDVIGLDGLVACRNDGPVLRWFLFQTVGRFVELALAFAIACGSRQASEVRLHHHYRN